MKGSENPSLPHLMLSSSQDDTPLEGILGKSLNLPLPKESCWTPGGGGAGRVLHSSSATDELGSLENPLNLQGP